MDIHELELWISINRIMDINKSIMYINKSIRDIHNAELCVYIDRIMDIHKSIRDINKSELCM